MTEKEAREVQDWIIERDGPIRWQIELITRMLVENSLGTSTADAHLVGRIRELFADAQSEMEAEQIQAAKDSYPDEGREYEPEDAA